VTEMVKITDKLKLDEEEIKRALMEQTDEYRQQFDQALVDPDMNEKQRLIALNFAANACSAIFNFIYNKAGIELRTGSGGLLSHTGYFMAKIHDVERKMKRETGVSDKRGILASEIITTLNHETGYQVDAVFIVEKKDGKLTLTLEDPDFEYIAEEIWKKGEALRTCRVCGCTDDHACPGGCYWVEDDLCSQCVGKEAL
jgi:hypothetical protein